MVFFQIETVTTDVILGLGLMFGLALILTFMTFRDLESFFIWLTIFAGFVVYGGLVDLWVLIACLVILGMIMVNIIYRKRGLE